MSANYKKDILNYSLSIVIPGLVNFFSIPLIKFFIGAESYGQYALWYGAFLVFIAAAIGWLSISIVRFRADFENANFFYKHLFRIIVWIGLFAFCCGFVSATIISGRWVFGLIFGAALVGSLFQNSLMAISQSNFLSRDTIYSESLRVLTFLSSYAIFLSLSTAFFLEKLFASLTISYVVSFLFLKRKNQISVTSFMRSANRKDTPFPYRGFFQFGVPLILWYLFSAAIPYIDKALIAKKYGHTVQGNYQAIFDLVYRAVNMAFAPVLMATFPYLTKAYKERNISKIFQVIKNTVIIELAIMLLSLVVYLIWGGKILLRLLNVPEDEIFFSVGALILSVAFIWQIAMMLHKPFELMKQTKYLLFNNFVAFMATLIPLAFIYQMNFALVAYPIGILIGAIAYAVLCIVQINRLVKRKLF